MVTIDHIEGLMSSGLETLWFHYDIASDVLYIRVAAARTVQTLAEETSDGNILLRRADNDRPAGLTVVNWWKRFGKGTRPDSIRELERSIEPWAAKVAA